MLRRTIQVWVTTLLVLTGCDRDSGAAAGLKGQSNVKLVFHGKALDQDGAPLPGVTFTFNLESIPKGWTFDRRGEPYDYVKRSVTSSEDGTFQLEVVGHRLELADVEVPTYTQLSDLDSSGASTNNRFYQLNSWGSDWFHSDPNNPATYVFLKSGVKRTAVLPSRGGSDSGGGQHWRTNCPAFPRRPSIPDVVYVPAGGGGKPSSHPG